MDPEETYRQLQAWAKRVNEGYYDDHPERIEHDQGRAAEHFEALDEWISRGGFPPAAWAPKALPVASGDAPQDQ